MGRKTQYRREFTISDFYCTECGNKGFSCGRKISKQREPGHLKKLYCMYCKKETNHAEIRPYGSYNVEDFMEEFNLGRFVDGKKIPVSDLMNCSKKDCEYNKNGKCWNSNYSFDCGHRTKKEA